MEYIKIHEKDNVAVALVDLKKGKTITIGDEPIVILDDIENKHKIAIKDIKKDDLIIKYGLAIGKAICDIKKGSWVHVHNVKTNLSDVDNYTYNQVDVVLENNDKKTFKGYRRKNHTVGIRNEIWIVPIVGCVNSIAKNIERECQDLIVGSIDGIYSYTHPYGCSQMGEDHNTTKKILTNLCKHPNACGILALGLGCENLTKDQFEEALGDYDKEKIKILICQDVEDEEKEARKIIQKFVNDNKNIVRTDIDASELIVGMKCGGSDGFSGITANALVGKFSDRLVSMGGTTVLTEVPEMFGAEDMLCDRCIDKNVFDKFVSMINAFKKYFVDHGQVVYENPSPGNKKGGITTLEDKSCGCVQKSGSAYVVDCQGYGDNISKKGLNLLSGPGNDIVSTTNLAASGCHMILFTTGRGTPFGAPVPTIKISSNTDLYNKKKHWIDFNAGVIVEGQDINQLSKELLAYVIDVASGKKTKQEEGMQRDIAIFKDGVTL